MGTSMGRLDIRHTTPTGVLMEIVGRRITLAVLGGALLVVLCWWASGQRPLGGLTFGIYLAVVGLLVLCEYRLPFDRQWGSAVRGTKTDFLYVIVATVMDKATFAVCVTTIASLGKGLAGYFHIDLWPSGWSLGFQVAAALLIADAATYFRHRLVHHWDLLWRFHRVHHSMTEMYWIRSAYTHPLEQLFILAAIMLPIALLGAGDQVVAVVALLFGLSGLLQHANIDARSSALNYVFATPEVHRVHHGADEGRHANFSAFFVLMDLVFGTYRPPARAPRPLRVGLLGETDFPQDFLSHLTIPFRRNPVEFDGDGIGGPSRSGGAAVSSESVTAAGRACAGEP